MVLSALPLVARKRLAAMRRLVKAAAPGVKEVVSYGIPAFRTERGIVIWIAGWKEHTAMYPITAAMRKSGGKTIAKYVKGKGTLHFPHDAPLPAALITRIVKSRAKELANK